MGLTSGWVAAAFLDASRNSADGFKNEETSIRVRFAAAKAASLSIAGFRLARCFLVDLFALVSAAAGGGISPR